jgi:RIO kinase 1
MKVNLNNLDSEEDDFEEFEKHKSRKRKLKGRQSVAQLVSKTENGAEPVTRFESYDLNELSRLGFLDELLTDIKSGKEATVYLGRNSRGYVAVKVYTDVRVRSFRRDDAYRQGRFVADDRIQKAMDEGSKRGLDPQQILWVQEEFRQMQFLHEYGVSVPQAIAVSGITLLMDFIGEEDGTPAPRIADLKMPRAEAEEAFRQAVLNLKLMVKSGRVHGDYSAFNILWHEGSAVVIDFPQVIEFATHPDALAFLERDVTSLCKSFKKQGIKADEAKILAEVRGK